MELIFTNFKSQWQQKMLLCYFQMQEVCTMNSDVTSVIYFWTPQPYMQGEHHRSAIIKGLYQVLLKKSIIFEIFDGYLNHTASAVRRGNTVVVLHFVSFTGVMKRAVISTMMDVDKRRPSTRQKRAVWSTEDVDHCLFLGRQQAALLILMFTYLYVLLVSNLDKILLIYLSGNKF